MRRAAAGSIRWYSCKNACKPSQASHKSSTCSDLLRRFYEALMKSSFQCSPNERRRSTFTTISTRACHARVMIGVTLTRLCVSLVWPSAPITSGARYRPCVRTTRGVFPHISSAFQNNLATPSPAHARPLCLRVHRARATSPARAGELPGSALDAVQMPMPVAPATRASISFGARTPPLEERSPVLVQPASSHWRCLGPSYGGSYL